MAKEEYTSYQRNSVSEDSQLEYYFYEAVREEVVDRFLYSFCFHCDDIPVVDCSGLWGPY